MTTSDKAGYASSPQAAAIRKKQSKNESIDH